MVYRRKTRPGPFPFTASTQNNAKAFGMPNSHGTVKTSVKRAIENTAKNVKNAVKHAKTKMVQANAHKENAKKIVETAVKNAKTEMKKAKEAEVVAANDIKRAIKNVRKTNSTLKKNM